MQFIKNGNMFMPAAESALDVHKKLPVGNYTIGFSPQGFFFQEADSFTLPKKLYGDTLKHGARILQTFNKRPNTTGVLMNGEKGSGKTLLTKHLSLEAAKLGMPTILVNNDWHGDAFNSLIQSVSQPAIMIFDEFEKVYGEAEQNEILTLLDGVFPSKKLFLFTCNDKYKVNTHMKNRPGRIFYYLEYKGLDTDFIREYCADNLVNQENTNSVVILSQMFDKFNFDMLASLIEEMNRYNETASEAARMLNIRPEYSSKQTHLVKMFKNGVEFKLGEEYSEVSVNPMIEGSFAVYYDVGTKDADGDEVIECQCFCLADMIKIDPETETFQYRNKDGFDLIMKRKPHTVTSVDHLF